MASRDLTICQRHWQPNFPTKIGTTSASISTNLQEEKTKMINWGKFDSWKKNWRKPICGSAPLLSGSGSITPDPDPSFQFSVDPDLDPAPHVSDVNLRPQFTGLQTIQGSFYISTPSLWAFKAYKFWLQCGSGFSFSLRWGSGSGSEFRSEFSLVKILRHTVSMKKSVIQITTGTGTLRNLKNRCVSGSVTRIHQYSYI